MTNSTANTTNTTATTTDNNNCDNENNTSTALNGDTVEIQGLDNDYNLLTETVTISGSGATTTGVFKRVFRAVYIDGAVTANSKRILIQHGTTTVAKVLEGIGQTMMSIYTIPAGFTGYLMRLDVTAQGTATGSFKLYCRVGGEDNFRVVHTAEVNGVGGPYQLEYPIPQSFPEKSDIDARMHTLSNNGRYTCTFDLLLVDNTAGTPQLGKYIMRIDEITINIPITIDLDGDKPRVNVAGKDATDDSEPENNPVMVSPQQQELELAQQQGQGDG